MQSRATQYERRMEREIQEKEGLLQDIAQPVSLKLMPLSYYKERLISCKELSVRYEGAEDNVLKNLTFELVQGERVFLHGENGCGKSTLLKIINGIIKPDVGTIEIGQTIKIGYFSQENEYMDSSMKVIDYVKEVGEYVTTSDGKITASQRLERFLFDRAMQWAKIEKLSGGEKRRLYLMRVLMSAPNVLILDEPTASLNEDDSQALLDLLLKFKEQGMTSIIISHKLNEISYVADKITVIRDGSSIETLDKKKDDFSEQRIIQGMVGREMTDRFPKRPNVKIGDVSMEVKNWNVYHPLYSERKVVDNVSFKVHKGEVVGISGLMGAGRTELAMSIFGKSYGTKISGQVFMNGKEVKLNTVQEAIDNKLAYVTEDRKGNGLILSKSIKMNTSLANMKGVSNGKVIDADKEYAVAEDYRKKLKTKCPSVEQNVGNLSGGNQQKVLLAKWMFAEPDILILDEPTRGIDVGAKYEIYCIINDLVAAGKSVIMISSELPEVLGMSDRIYIMNEGKFVGEVGKEEATSELIMSKIVKSGKGA